MTRGLYATLAATVLVATLGGCDRAARAPKMDAADLSDGRGARAGQFAAPADNRAAIAVGNAH